MFLVELVMQGVRGIRALARLRFQSGFNIVVAGNESGKTSSVDSMQRLLFPGNGPGLMESLVSRHTPDASRAALVVYADDGAYYRVIQDFSKRAVNLSKYNSVSKDFALAYKDWDSTAQFMGKLTAGITEEEYSRLFILRRGHWQTAAAPPQETAAAMRRQSVKGPGPGPDRSQEARLAELREALRKSEEASDADYRWQSGKLKLEEIRKKLDKIGEFAQRSAEIDANLEALQGCEKLPADLTELLDAHEQRQGEKMAKSDELNRDIEDMKLQLDALPQASLFKDKLFLAGVLLAVLSVVAGLFVLRAEQRVYFPLGLLLSLVPMGIGWYRGSRKNTERKALLKEVDALQDELHELEKSFQEGGTVILECMKATGCTTAAELKDKADNYRYFRSLRDEIDEELGRTLSGAAPEDLEAEYARQQQEVAELEAEAAAMAAYAVDAYSLRQDIERIEAELGQAAGGMDDLSAEFGFAAPAAPATGGGFVTDLAIAGRISGIEIETLMPAVAAAAQRNLSSVTNGKYVRIELGDGGDPEVHAQDHTVVPPGELSHGTRELLYFCLKTGLIEAIAGKRRLPLLLDDALAGFDPGRQQAACQVLRSLGTKTQVIFLTSNPGLRAAGDAASELK